LIALETKEFISNLDFSNPMAVSQNQIAKLTGFSRWTVSRALANHPLISEATKAAVNAAARSFLGVNGFSLGPRQGFRLEGRRPCKVSKDIRSVTRHCRS
jgi:hypothetical protein